MRIEHLAIWAENIELLKQFYTTYFAVTCGDKYVNTKRNYTSYFLSFEGGNTRIELMNVPDITEVPACQGKLKGLAHFAISVGGAAAVDALTERLRSDGYTVAGEPRTSGDGYYESVIVDPEGNLVEIVG